MKLYKNKYYTLLLIILILLLLCRYVCSFTDKSYQISSEMYNTDKYYQISSKMSNTDIINLRKGQHIMKDMLKEFHNLCICNNIKYWSQAGTLIGAVRHNGWIPWDGDVDVSMLTDDYKKLKNIIHLLPNDMIFSEPKDKPCSKIRTTKAIYEPSSYSQKDDWNMGIQIDIFLFDIEHEKKNKFIIGEWPVCGTPGEKKVPYKDIFPLKTKKFDDIYIHVPNKYKKICKKTWGNYPPPLIPIDERVCHEGRVKIL